MTYYLLTGATGLLGNYLLRDLLLADVPMAVLVRSSRKLSARQRVEGLLSDWEAVLGRTLPRPVVLEGDISQPDLGLDANDQRWVSEYCRGLIHNAASLSFQATSPEGEPYRSNVGGTRNVLEFARAAGIRQFHHVSTAYIAGLRSGRVLESETDVGQELGNDYEKAKLAAELLVRQAEFPEPTTVFRPGIIIGDSRTGFTTTYHGFYAALQLVHMVAGAFARDDTGRVGGHVVHLALDGTETKHLVPVDWVSAAMAHVITHPECHGRTYHLTPQHPVTTRLIRDVLEEAVGFYGAILAGADHQPSYNNEPEALFHEHIKIYNSYWRMDPEFDRANVERFLPHLPCPHVDRALLLKLSRTAIDSGFPTPSKKPVEVPFDAQRWMQPWLDLGASLSGQQPRNRLLGLDVHGTGGGQWQLIVQNGQVVGAETGIHAERASVCRTDVTTLASLAQGRQSWQTALANGAAVLEGNGLADNEYAALLDQLHDVTVS
uniref:NAD-dependent epimerase/dehydratase family protein n=1 Tax=Schlesneria paludicola TaxID=360056 RepID=A0A7C2NVD5_9PLAN